MIVVELFAGTAVFTDTARSRGHSALAIDASHKSNADIVDDIRKMQTTDLWLEFRRPDVVWLSPPCTTFSVASIGRYWPEGDISPEARAGVDVLIAGMRLMMQLRPKVWFLENPRAMMRKLPIMSSLPKHTVTYCQYGLSFQKPTDIFTNSRAWQPRPACKAGDSCHVAAPRGSRTGVQGIDSAAERARLPVDLCIEVLAAAERDVAGYKPPRVPTRSTEPTPLFSDAAE